MSVLRNNLDRAKAEYHSAGYPGDLATELLTLRIDSRGQGESVSYSNPGNAVVRPVTSNRWFWAGGLGSAVAAALVVGMFLQARPAPVNTSGGFDGFAVTGTRDSQLRFRAEPAPMAVPSIDNRFQLVDSPVNRAPQWAESPEVAPFDISPRFHSLQSSPGKLNNADYTLPPR